MKQLNKMLAGIVILAVLLMASSGYNYFLISGLRGEIATLEGDVAEVKNSLEGVKNSLNDVMVATGTGYLQDEYMAGLAAEARKEGKFMLYASYASTWTSDLVDFFHETYPFIEVSFYTDDDVVVITKFETEASVGVKTADVITSSMNSMLIENNLIAPYVLHSKDLAKYPTSMWDPQGYWFVGHMATIGYEANNALPDDILPKKYTDYINPRPEWKNKVVFPDPRIQSPSYLILYTLMQEYGEDTTHQIYQGLFATNPLFMSGAGSSRGKVASGERPIMFYDYRYAWYQTYKEGAPTKFILLDDIAVQFGLMSSIAANAPHPNAAKLFLEFLISDKFQTWITTYFGDYSFKEGIPPPEGAIPIGQLKAKLIPVDLVVALRQREELIAKFDAWVKEFQG